MTLQQIYESRVAEQRLANDEAQRRTIIQFDQLINRIQKRWFWQKPPKGIYLWGPTGRGKTMIMDLFFAQLKVAKKRVHFHEFMHSVHQEMHRVQGQGSLDKVVVNITQGIKVLCFDEFIVNDIADAMLLKRILELLLERGAIIVATSNVVPDNLYKNGLQRASFLPAIALIKNNLNVISMQGDKDYRFELLLENDLYIVNDEHAHSKLTNLFSSMSNDAVGTTDLQLNINSRNILAKQVTDTMAWFDFAALCQSPRAASDYLELALRYQAVFISDIPVLTEDSNDAARRFITLIDALYDHGVKLVISAAANPEYLYTGSRLAFEFQRCTSRLKQMQSSEYLHTEHQ